MKTEILIRKVFVCPVCGKDELRKYFTRQFFVWKAELSCSNLYCPNHYSYILGYGLTPEMAEKSALKKLEHIAKVVERISAEGEEK